MKVYRDIAGGHRVMTVDYCLPRDPAMDMVYGLGHLSSSSKSLAAVL